MTHSKNGACSSVRFSALNWADSRAIGQTRSMIFMNHFFLLTRPMRRRSSENGLRPLINCWVLNDADRIRRSEALRGRCQ